MIPFAAFRSRGLRVDEYGRKTVELLVMNSLALPIAFGDPTPWALGLETVYPSLTIHLVYGAVLGALASRARG